MCAVLSVKNATKYYGDRSILNDISFEIMSQDIVGLIGENGSGKTTLMTMISGTNNFSAGEISICEKSVKHDIPSYYSDLGVALDEMAFYPFFDATTNLSLFSDSGNLEHIEYLIKAVGLESATSQKISEYSFGMRQRLNVARAFINNPRLLVMDEPINGLDPKAVDAFKKFCRDYIVENNAALLISSHALKELIYFCNSYIFLRNGKIQSVINTKDKHIEQLNAFCEISQKSINAVSEYTTNFLVVESVGKIYMQHDQNSRSRLGNVFFLEQGQNVLEHIYISISNLEG
jgi:ABC-2 type transport system ATP-binding protein